MIKFPLVQKSHEFELGYGSYYIFFTGGWYIENLDELDLQFINSKTNESIILNTKDFFGLRRQDYVANQKAVAAFSFDIYEYSTLRLTINNPESLVLKPNHPIMFLLNLFYGKKIPIEKINIVIK